MQTSIIDVAVCPKCGRTYAPASVESEKWARVLPTFARWFGVKSKGDDKERCPVCLNETADE